MDSFLTRSAKKLEQALGVPRPWELTPATSVGYQMATGEGSIGERARRGTAQFLGRYATNIKEPRGYDLPSLGFDNFKNVLEDRPIFGHKLHIPHVSSRDVLFREMFDLPQREESLQSSGIILKKTAPKEYKIKNNSPFSVKPALSGELKKHVTTNYILGNVALTPNQNKSYSYRDVWDILSPDETGYYNSGITKPFRKTASSGLRKLIAPILRPATVSGEVPTP